MTGGRKQQQKIHLVNLELLNYSELLNKGRPRFFLLPNAFSATVTLLILITWSNCINTFIPFKFLSISVKQLQKEQWGTRKQHHAFKLAEHSPKSIVTRKVLVFQTVHERPNQKGRLVDKQTLFWYFCLFISKQVSQN